MIITIANINAGTHFNIATLLSNNIIKEITAVSPMTISKIEITKPISFFRIPPIL